MLCGIGGKMNKSKLWPFVIYWNIFPLCVCGCVPCRVLLHPLQLFHHSYSMHALWNVYKYAIQQMHTHRNVNWFAKDKFIIKNSVFLLFFAHFFRPSCFLFLLCNFCIASFLLVFFLFLLCILKIAGDKFKWHNKNISIGKYGSCVCVCVWVVAVALWRWAVGDIVQVYARL